MKFPDLETMVMYGIYTIKDLVKYSQNKLVKRNIKILNECESLFLCILRKSVY